MHTFRALQRRSGWPRARSRHALIAVLVVTAAAALAPSAALADGDLVATPTRVKDSASISVRWTPQAGPDKDLFTYELSVTNSDATGCSNVSSQPVAATWKTGDALRFSVRPSAGGRSWCPGSGVGVLIRVLQVPRTPGGSVSTLATAYVAVVDDPATPLNGRGILRSGAVQLGITPAPNVGLNTTVTVSWRTTVKLARDEGYQVVLQAGREAPSSNPTCLAALPRIVGRGTARGTRIRVRMNPYLRQGVSGWCPGEFGTLIVQRVKLDAKGKADPKLQDRIREVATAGGLIFKG